MGLIWYSVQVRMARSKFIQVSRGFIRLSMLWSASIGLQEYNRSVMELFSHKIYANSDKLVQNDLRIVCREHTSCDRRNALVLHMLPEYSQFPNDTKARQEMPVFIEKQSRAILQDIQFSLVLFNRIKSLLHVALCNLFQYGMTWFDALVKVVKTYRPILLNLLLISIAPKMKS